MPPVASFPIAQSGQGDASDVAYGRALSLLATLFFMWGFITVINGTLLPHLRSVFELSYFQAALIESVWFIAYFFASSPSAKLIERIGYQKSLVIGLLIMAIAGGALVAGQGWLADHYDLQWSFLLTATCELYILFYALWGSRPTHALPDVAVG